MISTGGWGEEGGTVGVRFSFFFFSLSVNISSFFLYICFHFPFFPFFPLCLSLSLSLFILFLFLSRKLVSLRIARPSPECTRCDSASSFVARYKPSRFRPSVFSPSYVMKFVFPTRSLRPPTRKWFNAMFAVLVTLTKDLIVA